MAEPTSAITRVMLSTRRLLMPPCLSRAEAELEQRKSVIRGRLRICCDRINRIGAVLEMGGAAETLSAACLLVADLRLLLLAFYGIPAPEKASAVLFKGLEQFDLATLPPGGLRDELETIVADLKSLLLNPHAEENILAIKAWVISSRQLVTRARAQFKALRAGELRTSREHYKRRLGVAASTASALIALVVGSGIAIDYATAPRITIDTATYGMSCNGRTVEGGTNPFQIMPGNATAGVVQLCQGGARSCKVTVSGWIFGDPAPLCAKDFTVAWRCSNGGERRVATLEAEAMGKTLRLTCREGPG
jgi:hypothetical protein